MADITQEKILTLAGLTTYDGKIKEYIDDGDSATLESAKGYADGLSGEAGTRIQTNADAITKLNGAVTVDGSVANKIQAVTGDLEDLDTTAKSDLVAAINEVNTAVGNAASAGAVTVETTNTTEGMAKSYTIKQNSATVAVIDIPKDMVVSSGAVATYTNETLPTGDGAPTTAGTYLVLTLANATSDKVYINVGTLIDIYTAQASATQVQLVINPSTREISASIVAGSIGATELATDAVTTVKIADGNVTKAKLATAVQTSLAAADSALQADDIATGSDNGTIAVGGTDVAVKGLASAAYAESTAFDAAGAATTAAEGVLGTSSDAATANTVYGAKAAISALDTRVVALESVEYIAITSQEISNLFDDGQED